MRKKEVFTDAEKELIISMYKSGLGSQTIGLRLRKNASAINKLIKDNNLMRGRQEGLLARAALGPLSGASRSAPDQKT